MGDDSDPAISFNDMLLGRYPPSIWGRKYQIFLDRCCGDGDLVTEMLRRRIAARVRPHQALKTMFAVDQNEENVIVTRLRALEAAGVADPLAKLYVVCRIRVGNGIEDRLNDPTYWAEPQNLTLPSPYLARERSLPWLRNWRPETLRVPYDGRMYDVIL